MAFVRLPVDRDGLHVIPLYREVPVVVVSKEHPVAAYDEIPVADLADEHLLQDPDDVPAWRDVATEIREGTRYPVPEMSLRQAVESVAAQAGIVVVPMSVARLHHRKDVVAVPVIGVEESQVGLAWPVEADDPRVETFIGIVRGRTERSSRGEAEVAKPKAKAKSQARAGEGLRSRRAPAGPPQAGPTPSSVILRTTGFHRLGPGNRYARPRLRVSRVSCPRRNVLLQVENPL